MKITKAFLALGAGLYLLCACSNKNEDASAPLISDVLFNEDSGSITIDASQLLNVTALIKDDQALDRVDVDLHESANGHSHKSSAAIKWVETKTVPLEGKEYQLETSFMVPLNVDPSVYHLVLTAHDEAGKQSVSEKDFNVINSSKPLISINNPLLDASTIVRRGTTLVLEGLVTDDTDISNIYITIEYPPGYSGNPDFFVLEVPLDGTDDGSWDFQLDGDLDIAIPANAKTGAYNMRVVALDNAGNSTRVEGKFNIEE